jgi:uncharacterized Zn-binding protein involved in type VI secretion
MLPVSRSTNDIAEGYCAICEIYTIATIITGSPNVSANGFPVANMDSIVQSACGHVANIIASTKNQTNSLPIATMGSMVQGVFTGSITTGSHNVRSS